MTRKAIIYIGEYLASRDPLVIQTILGSCVAVCLFDKRNRIGGMNHILLPGRPNLSGYNAPARYGINAMELLINRIMNLGGDRRWIVAKVFGGGHILPSISPDNGMGMKIVEFVKDFLHREKMEIAGQDVGGDQARKVIFHAHSGDAFVKRITRTKLLDIYIQEKRMSRNIGMELKKPGPVDLFP